MEPILLGLTGPSSFTSNLVSMVEDFFGANPVMLYQDKATNLIHDLRRVRAVILAGGADIHPRTYGKSLQSRKNMRNFDSARDRREALIIEYCVQKRIPMLGICRGHQLLGVIRKRMELIMDLSEEHTIHQPSLQEPKLNLDPRDPIHFVSLLNRRNYLGKEINYVEKSLLNSKKQKTPLYARKSIWVNSFHHQGLLFEPRHREDKTILGTAFTGGEERIVEIMHCPEELWLSVQWHPEYDYHVQESSRMVLDYFRNTYVQDAKISTGNTDDGAGMPLQLPQQPSEQG